MMPRWRNDPRGPTNRSCGWPRPNVARPGLRAGAPHPVRLLLTEHGFDLDRLAENLVASAAAT
jgi:hypothetical protein